MKFEPTLLIDCYKILPKVFEDRRGYFFESYNSKLFCKATGLNPHFVQDNQSRSSYGVVRGLHLQLGQSAQAKLVRAIEGEVLDVAVDLRPDSATFLKSFSCILSEDNKTQLFMSRGFAHGFAVLSEFATIHYKADNYYSPSNESGIIYNDPDLNIDWMVDKENINLSEKDKALPTLDTFIKKNL